jgi:hypothetical protein
MPLDMSRLEGPIEIIFDSTGLKVKNRGEWMKQKYQVRRGFVKLNITCDRAEKHTITSSKVTDERIHDTKEFKPPLCQRKGKSVTIQHHKSVR